MRILRQPRLRISATEGPRVAHLLVVAGASGSGKSTFLKQLVDGGLPAELLAALPPGAAAWPQTNGRRVIRGTLRPLGTPPMLQGLVLHYDVMRPFETALSDYGDDRSLAVLGAAEKITLVVVRASGDQLARQVVGRPPKRRMLDAVGVARLRNAWSGLRGRPSLYAGIAEDARHAKLVDLYGRPGFVDGWYARWDAFIRRAAGKRLTLPIAEVEPVPGGERGIEFRLCKTKA
jgi:hypothetical protein